MLETARSNADSAQKTVLALLDCWQARAHAERDEKRQVGVLLNRADDVYGTRRDGDDPDWIYWMRQPTLTAEAGTAMRQIGELAHGERMLTEGIPLLRQDATRDHSLYLVRIAEAQWLAGERDRAEDNVRRAIEMSPGVESARVTDNLDALVRRFPPGTFTD